jgi:hypothetical protein
VRQADIVTIVVCPPAPGDQYVFDFAGLESELTLVAASLGTGVMVVPAVDYESQDDDRTKRAHWVAALAVAMSAGAISSPITLVLAGASGALAPAVGFSQRAARRLVIGYILIDAELPTVGGAHEDWPDAPVIYLHSPQAQVLNVNQARLRGWDVVAVANAHASTVTDAIAEIIPSL